jgi:hypothetical protein
LRPAFVEDALEPSDPVFFINDVVDNLDVTPLERRDALLGAHVSSTRLLLKLYAGTQGVYSGREIARRLRRMVAEERPPQDTGRAAACRDQRREGVSALRATGTRERARGMGPGVCRLPPASTLCGRRRRVSRSRRERAVRYVLRADLVLRRRLLPAAARRSCGNRCRTLASGPTRDMSLGSLS